ncbi:hypothetical protein [uncultured Paraglaciecola sp.]|uniref:hypothetical protein n=1 Tax=uncultured Paraglaciecola sp. TaxID=1765024 RepID=UPI00261EED4E|nr:hypothetical protein [uncultured Paraglaciecola sp.]
MAKKQTYTKYDPAWCDKLPGMFKNGESVAEVCAVLGIGKKSFYRYIEKHADFAEAYDKGRDLSEAWWLKKGRNAVNGKAKHMDTTAWIFNMKNRFGWADKKEVSGPDRGAIPIAASITFVGVSTDGRRRPSSHSDDCAAEQS